MSDKVFKVSSMSKFITPQKNTKNQKKPTYSPTFLNFLLQKGGFQSVINTNFHPLYIKNDGLFCAKKALTKALNYLIMIITNVDYKVNFS